MKPILTAAALVIGGAAVLDVDRYAKPSVWTMPPPVSADIRRSCMAQDEAARCVKEMIRNA